MSVSAPMGTEHSDSLGSMLLDNGLPKVLEETGQCTVLDDGGSGEEWSKKSAGIVAE